MLDAFIIDRIRRQQEEAARRQERIPLQIEVPRPPRGPEVAHPRGSDPHRDEGRGIAVIDFSIG